MVNEKRLIDANALLQKLHRMIDYCKADNKVTGLTALFQVGDSIMDCKTVEAAEVAHGRWDANGRCTKCGGHAPFYSMASTYYKSPYCHECGAKMDAEGF